MEYHIFDFCPLQVKKIKAIDKNTVEYKKELSNFMLGCTMFLGVNWEKHLDCAKYNKRKKTKNILFFTLALWVILGVYMLEITEKMSSTFVADLVAIILALFIVIYGIIIWKLYSNNKKTLFNYVSKLIDDYVPKKHSLTDEELELVVMAFKDPHSHYDDSYHALKIGCYKCLKMVDIKKVWDGEYNNFECPYCKSDKLICQTEKDSFDLNKKLLEQIKEYFG